jgi:prevent-host-death family protein
MGTVTKTELTKHTAKVLERVASGERLTITDRGRPIAELTPPVQTKWQRLVASGRVTLPTRSGALQNPVETTTRGARDILQDIRRERV